MPKYENWIDVFPGQIPKRQYFLQLCAGEEHGLLIHLLSSDCEVKLEFPLIAGLNVLDEGVLLWPYEGYDDSDAFLQLRANHFPSTIYLVENGAYAHSIRQTMGDLLFSAYNLRQYNIVTENYVIIVVSHDVPTIQVKSIE